MDLRERAEGAYCARGRASWQERDVGWEMSCKRDDGTHRVQFDRAQKMVSMEIDAGDARMDIALGKGGRYEVSHTEHGVTTKVPNDARAAVDRLRKGLGSIPDVVCPKGTSPRQTEGEEEVALNPERTGMRPAETEPGEAPVYGGLMVRDVDLQRYCLDDEGRLHGPYIGLDLSPYRLEQGQYARGRKVGTWKTTDADGKVSQQAHGP